MLNQSLFTPGCIRCGSLLVEVSLFCELCFKKFIEPKFNLPVLAHTGHIYLIEWNKGDDLLLGQLVYRLKARQSPEAINFYSDFLAKKLSDNLDLQQFKALIPIPGSSAKRIHSQLIANRLAQRTGLKQWALLQKAPTAKQQKVLSSAERKIHNSFQRASNPPEEFTSEEGRAGPYIFVDDVLTTGQSVKHAESSLELSKRNAVATLFYRPSHLN